MGFGLLELLVLVGIILLLVGGKKLPEIGSGLAKAIKGFKQSIKETDEINVTPKPNGEEPKQGAGSDSEETSSKKAT
jgi:sec-independent protein translocase protein TatA